MLQIGARGLLLCEVQGNVGYIHWRKGPISFNNPPLILFSPNVNGSNKEGPGYESGFYDVTEDFSLVINNVTIENEDTYICTVHDVTTKTLFSNETEVNVFGKYQY